MKTYLREFWRKIICFKSRHPLESVYHHTLYCPKCDLYFGD